MKRWLLALGWAVARRMFRRQMAEDVSAVLSPAFELGMVSSWTLHELDAALKSGQRPARHSLLRSWGGKRVAAAALAFLWTSAAFADQHDSRTGFCHNDAGLPMPCDEVERLPVKDAPKAKAAKVPPKVVTCYHVDGPKKGEVMPCPSNDFELDAGLGIVASLSSEASSGEPTAEVSAAFDVATNDKSPRLALLARFSALPGETVSLSDPTTFRSLGIEATLSQPLWSNLRLRPALMIGAEFRFAGDAEPLHRAARYAYVGTRVDGDAGYLFLGVGGDERLSVNSRETPQYMPAAAVGWQLRLATITGRLDAYLTGRVLLFLRVGYGYTSAGSDVAQIGVLVGYGAKR